MNEPVCNTVLIVDDDEDIRDTVAELLRAEGYAVATAGNGEEAIAYLRANQTPCLMLLDLMMPVMDGWSVLATLQGDNGLAPALPVVVMSAAGQRALRTVETAAATLAKPVGVDLLLDTVKRCCSG
jgi:CheY-like chemotaxis protein